MPTTTRTEEEEDRRANAIGMVAFLKRGDVSKEANRRIVLDYSCYSSDLGHSNVSDYNVGVSLSPDLVAKGNDLKMKNIPLPFLGLVAAAGAALHRMGLFTDGSWGGVADVAEALHGAKVDERNVRLFEAALQPWDIKGHVFYSGISGSVKGDKNSEAYRDLRLFESVGQDSYLAAAWLLGKIAKDPSKKGDLIYVASMIPSMSDKVGTGFNAPALKRIEGDRVVDVNAGDGRIAPIIDGYSILNYNDPMLKNFDSEVLRELSSIGDARVREKAIKMWEAVKNEIHAVVPGLYSAAQADAKGGIAKAVAEAVKEVAELRINGFRVEDLKIQSGGQYLIPSNERRLAEALWSKMNNLSDEEFARIRIPWIIHEAGKKLGTGFDYQRHVSLGDLDIGGAKVNMDNVAKTLKIFVARPEAEVLYSEASRFVIEMLSKGHTPDQIRQAVEEAIKKAAELYPFSGYQPTTFIRALQPDKADNAADRILGVLKDPGFIARNSVYAAFYAMGVPAVVRIYRGNYTIITRVGTLKNTITDEEGVLGMRFYDREKNAESTVGQALFSTLDKVIREYIRSYGSFGREIRGDDRTLYKGLLYIFSNIDPSKEYPESYRVGAENLNTLGYMAWNLREMWMTAYAESKGWAHKGAAAEVAKAVEGRIMRAAKLFNPYYLEELERSSEAAAEAAANMIIASVIDGEKIDRGRIAASLPTRALADVDAETRNALDQLVIQIKKRKDEEHNYMKRLEEILRKIGGIIRRSLGIGARGAVSALSITASGDSYAGQVYTPSAMTAPSTGQLLRSITRAGQANLDQGEKRFLAAITDNEENLRKIEALIPEVVNKNVSALDVKSKLDETEEKRVKRGDKEETVRVPKYEGSIAAVVGNELVYKTGDGIIYRVSIINNNIERLKEAKEKAEKETLSEGEVIVVLNRAFANIDPNRIKEIVINHRDSPEKASEELLKLVNDPNAAAIVINPEISQTAQPTAQAGQAGTQAQQAPQPGQQTQAGSGAQQQASQETQEQEQPQQQQERKEK